MSAKHTPGPWKHIPWHIEEGCDAVRAPEGWLICTTASSEDARLIASAPDLLAALKAMRDLARKTPELQGRDFVSLGIQVNNAIDKAGG